MNRGAIMQLILVGWMTQATSRLISLWTDPLPHNEEGKNDLGDAHTCLLVVGSLKMLVDDIKITLSLSIGGLDGLTFMNGLGTGLTNRMIQKYDHGVEHAFYLTL